MTLTNEQKIEHQSAWFIMQSQYPGIEKWQRITVYEQVVAKGMSHEGALEAAHGCAKGDLPEVIFTADESSRIDPGPQLTEEEIGQAYQEMKEREQC
jgi:hypothetical protein